MAKIKIVNTSKRWVHGCRRLFAFALAIHELSVYTTSTVVNWTACRKNCLTSALFSLPAYILPFDNCFRKGSRRPTKATAREALHRLNCDSQVLTKWSTEQTMERQCEPLSPESVMASAKNKAVKRQRREKSKRAPKAMCPPLRTDVAVLNHLSMIIIIMRPQLS